LNVTPQAAATSLLSAAAVRERAHEMLALGDRLPHFRVDLTRMDRAVELVLDTIRAAYPSLDVPFHSRWRHFVVGETDHWAVLDRATAWPSVAARACSAFDLAIVSVLLDAGAGPDWRFHHQGSGQRIGRSEGLALASLEMFRSGTFSARRDDPLRVDAAVLTELSDERLATGFQVSDGNPLFGLAGRGDLLRRLGRTVLAAPEIFGRHDTPRPGGLFDRLASIAESGRVQAPTILTELLHHLASIWPSRLTLGGIALGDCWRHGALVKDDPSSELAPLHKLSQWLAYSLIEPLQWAGLEVVDIEGLTGLAEYRNGGLFIDTGVLTLRDPRAAGQPHDVASELVVEWRALTVALLDVLADAVRDRLQLDRRTMPLAKILQGGTWAAGRIIARKLRPDGAPPLHVISDGTVF
jgi:hypothetical protein